MPARTFDQAFSDALLEFLWSLWSELGVSGWARRHQSWVIDPEPLILLTAALGDRDPRLRDETLDWCLRCGRYVSLARLRNILKTRMGAAPIDVRHGYGRYAATVNAHSSQRWPLATDPFPFEPSGKSRLPSFERASLLHLRLRAFLGVSARAEILRAFLMCRTAQLTAADLVDEGVAYTKRAVRDALEDLAMAGVLEQAPLRNTRAFRLPPKSDLLAVEPLARPLVAVRWLDLAVVLYRLATLVEMRPDVSSLTRALHVRRGLHEIEGATRRALIPAPPTDARGDSFLPAFEEWALGLVRQLASGEAPPIEQPRRSREA